MIDPTCPAPGSLLCNAVLRTIGANPGISSTDLARKLSRLPEKRVRQALCVLLHVTRQIRRAEDCSAYYWVAGGVQ